MSEASLRSTRAVAALAVNPAGIGGIWVKARMSPARDVLVAALVRALPHKRISPNIADSQLFGGLSVASTIAAGKPEWDDGLLHTERVLALTMAERCPPAMAGRLAQWIDQRAGCLIALDEGADPDERLPAALADRIGIYLDVSDVSVRECQGFDVPMGDIERARSDLASVVVSMDVLRDAVSVCESFGCIGSRGPMSLLAVARALAALDRAEVVSAEHLEEAAILVIPARATRQPEMSPPEQNDAPPPMPENAQDADSDGEGPMPEDFDRLVEAVSVALPSGLLDGITGRASRARSGAGTGSGDRVRSGRRGRPLPPRPGRPDGHNRIDLVATLRTAAPWQPLRRSHSSSTRFLQIRTSDIRVRRFEERRDRVLIFCVDASGSSAMARMAEAKGAVELLLAEAYSRRDHVALIAFGGAGAEELLPPTRSLVQTKRRLAFLPGGGGTPLAAGLLEARRAAKAADLRALSPALVVLTDGRANIALDGTANRPVAGEDAIRVARSLGEDGYPALVIDTGQRPSRDLATLADTFHGDYLALPRADAHGLSAAVTRSLDL